MNTNLLNEYQNNLQEQTMVDKDLKCLKIATVAKKTPKKCYNIYLTFKEFQRDLTFNS